MIDKWLSEWDALSDKEKHIYRGSVHIINTIAIIIMAILNYDLFCFFIFNCFVSLTPFPWKVRDAEEIIDNGICDIVGDYAIGVFVLLFIVALCLIIGIEYFALYLLSDWYVYYILLSHISSAYSGLYHAITGKEFKF